MQDFGHLDRHQWHQRYLAQADWTQHIRQHILKTIKPHSKTQILEVGSGTGAILESLRSEGYRNLTGVDIDLPSLSFSKSTQFTFKLLQADGHHLPFSQDCFEISLCHYLLMWTKSPALILREMNRVTKPGGWVLALAEPDHQRRIDYPPPLEALGHYQTQALKEQGVDISMGRKLRSLFHETGLQDVEAGLLGAEWHQKQDPSGDETEWVMLRADLESRLTIDALRDFQKADRQARQERKRILFIPTFYALGRVA